MPKGTVADCLVLRSTAFFVQGLGARYVWVHTSSFVVGLLASPRLGFAALPSACPFVPVSFRLSRCCQGPSPGRPALPVIRSCGPPLHPARHRHCSHLFCFLEGITCEPKSSADKYRRWRTCVRSVCFCVGFIADANSSLGCLLQEQQLRMVPFQASSTSTSDSFSVSRPWMMNPCGYSHGHEPWP